MSRAPVAKPAQTSAGARVGRPPRLERGQIVEAALELMDEVGWSSFSMRALARRVDADVAALYGHVSDKNDLLRAILDELVARIPSGRRLDNPEAEVLLHFAALNKIAFEHLDLFVSALRGVEPGDHPASVRARDHISEQLRRLSLDEEQVSFVFRALYAHAIGVNVWYRAVAQDAQDAARMYEEDARRLLSALLLSDQPTPGDRGRARRTRAPGSASSWPGSS